jgi:ribosome-binding factor A
MSAYRKEKIEAEIRRIIAEAFIKEIKDPRIGFITVTSAKISKDYKVVNVGISVIGDDRDKNLTLAGAESAAGFFQHLVAKSLKLRNTPRIKFHLDSSIEEGVRMVGIIENLDKGS